VIAQIDGSALAEAIRAAAWAYPVLEAVHLCSLAALFGGLLVLDLRLFGAGRDIGLRPLARLSVRVAAGGFLGAAGSGALLWASDASALSENPAFLAKLALITVAGVNAALFHLRGSVRRHDRIAHLQAGVSLALWIGVIFAGRLIAYV
jgi:hypothetical protein